VLAGSQCLSPARVYDARSVRVAEAVGYKVGLLAGSGVAATALSAPNLVLHTITEDAMTLLAFGQPETEQIPVVLDQAVWEMRAAQAARGDP
jgi:oxaloacetate decarboxylase